MNTHGTEPSLVTIKRMTPHPLDDYNKVSALANITAELPSHIRYVGMGPVWSVAEQKYYFFKNGIANSNFVEFESGSSSASIRTYADVVNTEQGMLFEMNHDLDAQNLNVTFMHQGSLVLMSYTLGKIDGSEVGNWITFTTNADYTGLSVFVIARTITAADSSDPNLDDTITALQLKTVSTITEFNTLQKVGDEMIVLASEKLIFDDKGPIATNFSVDCQDCKNVQVNMTLNGSLTITFADYDIDGATRIRLVVHKTYSPATTASISFAGADIVKTVFTNGVHITTSGPSIILNNTSATNSIITTIIEASIDKHPTIDGDFIFVVHSATSTAEWTA